MCAIWPADAAISSELALISAVMLAVSAADSLSALASRRSSSIIAATALRETADFVVRPDLVDLLREIARGDRLGGLGQLQRRTGDAPLDEPARRSPDRPHDQHEHHADAAERARRARRCRLRAASASFMCAMTRQRPPFVEADGAALHRRIAVEVERRVPARATETVRERRERLEARGRRRAGDDLAARSRRGRRACASPPALPCVSTESTIDSPNFTFTTPTRGPPSRMTPASSTTVRCVAGSAVACAVVVPTAQAVCHQPSSLWTKSDDGEVVTAL